MEAARGDSKVDGGGVVHAVGGVGARLEHRHTFVAGCQRLPPDLQPNVASAGGNRPIHPNRGSRSPSKRAGRDSVPPEPTWEHVGARLGHLLQLRSGCQRSVAEFGRYVVCAGGSRPIHPNRGTGLPPKGLGGDPTPKIRPNRRHRARAGRGSNARSRPCRTTTLSATFPFQREAPIVKLVDSYHHDLRLPGQELGAFEVPTTNGSGVARSACS